MGSTVMFSLETAHFPYPAHTELTVRVWRHHGGYVFVGKDRLIGESQLPLGPELEDFFQRSLQLPLSKQGAHAGVVWLQFGLVQKEDASTDSTLSSIAGSVGEAVSGSVAVMSAMVSGMEGKARTASLR